MWGLFSQSAWAAPVYSLQANDPYAASPLPRADDELYTLDLRVINHGTEVRPEMWNRQVIGLENVYSQCSHVNFRVNVVSVVSTVSTELSDHLVDAHAGQTYLPQAFIDFFSPWISSRISSRSEAAVDVHWVDYLSPGDRKRYTEEAEPTAGFFGQAFHPGKLDRFYPYAPEVSETRKPSEIAGNTVVAAMTAFRIAQENQNGLRLDQPDAKVPSSVAGFYFAKNSTLIAHEIGHLLMNFELLDKDGNPISHACPGKHDYCPRENLMSAGGSAEYVAYEITPRGPGRRLGYSPAAEIEPEQCAMLKANPLVHRIR